jgi:hypothetical protein
VATVDVVEAARQLEYRIEAGSTRRPNKELEAQTMSTLATTLLPLLQQYSVATGDIRPLNNLIADYTKALSLDPNRYMLQAPPPGALMPGAAEPQPGGVDEGQQAPLQQLPAPTGSNEQ